MTRTQLNNAVKNHDYIAVRYADGDVCGVNCRAVRKLENKVEMNDEKTYIVSYYPISFNEYIRIKIPFIKTKRKCSVPAEVAR